MNLLNHMKKGFRYIIFLVIVVLVIFIVIESYLTFMLYHPNRYGKDTQKVMHEYYQKESINIIQYQKTSAQFDNELFYILKKGEFEFSNYEFSNKFRVNSLGCRDDESSLKYPKIISIGDSYAMGWGVEQEESYSQLIEHKLGVKVLNMGISSYGTPREVSFLKRVNTDSLEILILQHCNNDNEEIRNYILHNGRLKVSNENAYKMAIEHFDDRMSYYPFKYTFSLFPKFFRNEQEKNPPAAVIRKQKTVVVDLYKGFLDVIKNSNNLNPNVRIIVFTLGVKGFNDGFLKGVKSALDMEFGSRWHDQIEFIDMSSLFNKKDYYLLDAHINKNGHKKVAEKLLETIQAKDTAKVKKWYYDDGSLAIEAQYKNGFKNGLCRYYWPNGVVSRECNYRNAYPVGKIIDFSKNGDTLKVSAALKR